MTIYSHSRLETFENCRLKFKYQYIDRLPRETDSIETFLGRIFHEVMEKLYKEIGFREPALEDLKNYLNELWDKNYGPHVFIRKPDRLAEDYRMVGLKALADYYNRYHPFNIDRILGVEKTLYIDLNSQYRVKCLVDRLTQNKEGVLEIHDYKTSGDLPVQAKLDKDRQLALYEIAVRQAWPDIKDVDLVWHYVCFDKEMHSHRTLKELEELKSNTISLIKEIESTTEYSPKQSALCEWCSFQNICPLFSHKFKTDELPPDEYLKEDGVQLVNKYSELDAKKGELKSEIARLGHEQEKIEKAVFEVAAKDGVTCLYGSDHKLKIKEDLRIKYPTSKEIVRPEFEEKIKELGLWDRAIDLSYVKLKGIAKSENWLEKVPNSLSELVKIEPTKSVYLSKRKDIEED